MRPAAVCLGLTREWDKRDVAGTLGDKKHRLLESFCDFAIGDWGCTIASFRVINRVSKTECLVVPINIYRPYKTFEPVLIRGLDMSKVTDGVEFVLQYPVVIQTTYTYTAVSGSKKTVLVLEYDETKFKKVADAAREARERPAKERARAKEERKAAIEAAKWRTWTDAAGKYKIHAKFCGLATGKVKLMKDDGSTVLSWFSVKWKAQASG